MHQSNGNLLKNESVLMLKGEFKASCEAELKPEMGGGSARARVVNQA